MRPPLCEYDIYRQEWLDQRRQRRWDAVAMIRPCGHEGHFYVDFDARLKRFNRDLHLGFDLKMGRWCIYRWTPEVEKLDKHESVGYVHRYMDVLLDMKWAVQRKRKDGSKFMEFFFREPGDWVFNYLREFKPGKLLGYNYWVGDELKAIAARNEKETQENIGSFVKEWAGDVMSWADRGNPGQLRKSVVNARPQKAAKKEAKKKAELVTA